MHCPVRHTHITHYCPCQSLHHTRCPLASPCPIMLHWTPWCCFYKLSGHICRSLCREVQSCSVFLLQSLLCCMVCSQGKTNLESSFSRIPSSESKITMIYLVFLLMNQIVYGWWKKDNIPIRSVRWFALETYTGQERHLCLSLQLCALQFLLTTLTKFLRVFRCFRGNQHCWKLWFCQDVKWH